MKRLTTREDYPHGAEGRSENNLTGNYCRGVFEATAVVERLAYYENLEESLRKSYGDCDNLLEEIVRRLIDKNSGKSQPKSARLLTDEDAEKWMKWKELEEEGKLLELPCKPGDTVYELCKCDDGIYRIFPMTVKAVNPYGAIRETKDGISELWNIYAESDYTYMYKSFYDIGETVFLKKPEAQAALEEMNHAE